MKRVENNEDDEDYDEILEVKEENMERVRDLDQVYRYLQDTHQDTLYCQVSS